MDAVRVPPSAWMTSQSTITWRSPSIAMLQTARSDRPIKRWISCVRPDGLPSFTSRRIRSADAPGSIEYSAVTQPLPLPRIQRGTSSSTDAVHSTLVAGGDGDRTVEHGLRLAAAGLFGVGHEMGEHEVPDPGVRGHGGRLVGR